MTTYEEMTELEKEEYAQWVTRAVVGASVPAMRHYYKGMTTAEKQQLKRDGWIMIAGEYDGESVWKKEAGAA